MWRSRSCDGPRARSRRVSLRTQPPLACHLEDSTDGSVRRRLGGAYRAESRPMEIWDDRARWPMALEIATGTGHTRPTGMMAEEQRTFCGIVRGRKTFPSERPTATRCKCSVGSTASTRPRANRSTGAAQALHEPQRNEKTRISAGFSRQSVPPQGTNNPRFLRQNRGFRRKTTRIPTRATPELIGT